MLNENQKSRVFIVQECEGKNFLPARRYGKLVPLMGDVQIYLRPLEAVVSIECGLRDFTESDYLLLVGDPVAIGIAFAAAARRTGGRVNVLKWDRQTRAYAALEVELSAVA